MSTDAQIEQEIVAKGLTAPRVTPADLEAAIAGEYTFTAKAAADAMNMPATDALGLLTICILSLKNGFTIVGKSACASPKNFDAELGAKIARQDAVSQMWPLLGYALKDRLMPKQG